jgi:Cu/Ag efflux pump CusA
LIGVKGQVGVRYQIKPIELGEADLADVRVCNEYDESVVTFTFPDDHEAYIARALMIRAFGRRF